MTRKQAERAAEVVNNLVVAITIGAGGDLFVVGTRIMLDVAGLVFALLCFGGSQKLTGRMGGPTL